MAFRLFNWVRFIVIRDGMHLEHQRRWPPFCDLPQVGEEIEVKELRITGKVTRTIRSGSKLLKVYVTPQKEGPK